MSEDRLLYCSISSVDRDIPKDRIYFFCRKVAERKDRNVLFANFYFSVLSQESLFM